MLRLRQLSIVIIISLSSPVALAVDDARPTHELTVNLMPKAGGITVTDHITLSRQTTTSPDFLLNGGLDIETGDGKLQQVANMDHDGLKRYRVLFSRPMREFTISYRGTIGHIGSKGMDDMPGALISEQGVYLDGVSAWYPVFDQPIGHFTLTVIPPANWEVISQGKREKIHDSIKWSTSRPQDEIYLLAGPFHRYAQDNHGIGLSVYLLDDDPVLADKYLSVMGQQIDLYSRLIGDYPYPKFAVVENRWQTGYGMPSFTLLGSRVIRLPFIPYTSLPHEILHNWWGNGVWVDYPRGNWSEGLTAYLADHLMKERKAKGAEYRRKALERYASFAAERRDFPLIEFRARHGEASQAIGYSKSLMLFHMLRRQLGDEVFRQALRDFWRDWQFRRAGFMDAIDSFAHTAGLSLNNYRDFLTRPGAPQIKIADARVSKVNDGFHLSVTIEQTQHDEPFRFKLPVAVTLAGEAEARWLWLSINERSTHGEWHFSSRPLRLDIDPAYDVFRLLDDSERPPSLGQMFGAQRQWLVLPTQAPDEERKAWQGLAAYWQQRYGNVTVIDDTETKHAPPTDEPVWLLGWNNVWLDKSGDDFNGPDQVLSGHRALLAGQSYHSDTDSVVLMSPQAAQKLAFIGASTADAINALARKLPHYSSYGRLVFDRGTNKNTVRESLSPASSPLSVRFSATDVPLRLPERPPLVEKASE